MKKLLLTILGPFVVVASIGLGVYWWDRGALPGFRPPTVDVTVKEINREHRGVRLKGTAHYELRILQEKGTYILYPLMERGDTTSKEIHVLVRSHKVPDRLTSFEDVTVEGFARPPGRSVPRSVADALMERGYYFEADVVLVEEYED